MVVAMIMIVMSGRDLPFGRYKTLHAAVKHRINRHIDQKQDGGNFENTAGGFLLRLTGAMLAAGIVAVDPLADRMEPPAKQDNDP